MVEKTVLVTGAGGFIGLNVTKAYAEHGWKVYALVHKNVPDELRGLNNTEIIFGDVTDKEMMSGWQDKFDIVVHVAGLAADTGKDEKFRKLNFEPVTYLSKIPKEKFVYISSSDVYGIKDFENADEKTPLIEYPKNPYPKYKIMAENWLRKNCNNYVIIRPAAVWGENDKTLENRFVEFLKTSPAIVHFGKWRGKNRWPLANVKNVANTIVSVSETNNFDREAITIIDPEKTTIDEYYKNLAAKYFSDKKYFTIYLPFWSGKLIGVISTLITNVLNLKQPVYDPTFYAVHHVSSNLDFSSKKMEAALDLLKFKAGKE